MVFSKEIKTEIFRKACLSRAFEEELYKRVEKKKLKFLCICRPGRSIFRQHLQFI